MLKNRFSNCIKHFDSKCLKIDGIWANLILTLFVKICIVFTMSIKFIKKTLIKARTCIHTDIDTDIHTDIGHMPHGDYQPGTY